jgi:hypothetical protein
VAKKVTQWEYVWVIPDDDNVIEVLNQLGQQGWEVVRAPDFHESEGAYFLKRTQEARAAFTPLPVSDETSLGLGSFFGR